MKKLSFIVFVLFLIGCETIPNSPTAADAIIETIEITYAPGDTQNRVTKDITLMTSTPNNADAEITWESLNEAVISSEGFITRPEQNTTVRLVVRVSLNGLYAQKIFDLIVLGDEEEDFITVTLKIFDQMLTYQLTEPALVSSFNEPNIEGYVFKGWLDENNQIVESNFTIESSMTLSASFEAVVTVQYEINIYLETLNETYELHNSIFDTGNVGETLRYVTSFEGFDLSRDSVTEIVLSESSKTLNVYFDRQSFNVVFYNQGGVYQSVMYLYGDVIEEPVLSSDVKHWSLTAQGSPYDFQTLVTNDVNLYAVYDEPDLIFTGYYASLDGVSDDNLFHALQTLIQDYTYVSYGDARDILQESDEDPNNPSNVILVYNRDSVRSTWDFGATWNREHVWPRSLLNNSTAEADPHNLKPSDPVINSTRGNDQFASGSGVYGRVSGGWFPGEEDKGDVARIVMYVSMMWEINLSVIGNVNTLLQWHQDDPVDDFERNRNDVLYTYTDHRNPYIDYPELVYTFYGMPSNAPFYMTEWDAFYDQHLMISKDVWIEKLN